MWLASALPNSPETLNTVYKYMEKCITYRDKPEIPDATDDNVYDREYSSRVEISSVYTQVVISENWYPHDCNLVSLHPK